MADVLLVNCSVTGLESAITDAGLTLDDTDCQFEWPAPVWPEWNALSEYFSSNVLCVDCTTPPLPGIPPYTDYDTGLFGEARTGIGAVLFEEPPVGISVDLKDYSTGTVNTREWSILNRTSMEYEVIGTGEEVLDYFLDFTDTDYVLVDTAYHWEFRLSVANDEESDTKDRTLTVTFPPYH